MSSLLKEKKKNPEIDKNSLSDDILDDNESELKQEHEEQNIIL